MSSSSRKQRAHEEASLRPARPHLPGRRPRLAASCALCLASVLAGCGGAAHSPAARSSTASATTAVAPAGASATAPAAEGSADQRSAGGRAGAAGGSARSAGGSAVGAAGSARSAGGSARASAGSARAARAGARPRAGSARIVASHDRITTGTHVQHAAPGTGGSAVDAENPGRGAAARSGRGRIIAAGTNPCSLVPEAAARAAVGGLAAAPVEALQGPTCIYRPARDSSYVTLTVQTLDLTQVRSRMHRLTRISVGGRAAYCGIYGRETTFVPLTGGRVLTITATCAVGRRLAALALPRLAS